MTRALVNGAFADNLGKAQDFLARFRIGAVAHGIAVGGPESFENLDPATVRCCVHQSGVCKNLNIFKSFARS